MKQSRAEHSRIRQSAKSTPAVLCPRPMECTHCLPPRSLSSASPLGLALRFAFRFASRPRPRPRPRPLYFRSSSALLLICKGKRARCPLRSRSCGPSFERNRMILHRASATLAPSQAMADSDCRPGALWLSSDGLQSCMLWTGRGVLYMRAGVTPCSCPAHGPIRAYRVG